MKKLSSFKIVEEDDEKRNLRVITCLMDSFDEIVASDDEDFVDDKISFDVSLEDISWEDIKHAFCDVPFQKYSKLELERGEEEAQDAKDSFKGCREAKQVDGCIEADPFEGYPVKHLKGYGVSNKDDEYNKDAKSYPSKSLNKKIRDGKQVQIGLDIRDGLQSGNLLDDAVDVKRSRQDFSIGR
jgi:hypothetical protein